MSVTTVGAGGGDSLTRTTLRIDGAPTGTLIAGAIHALQRVPGVLLADVDPGTGRATIAHDSAVPVGALVAAALRAGVRVTVVRGAERPEGANVPSEPARGHAVARARALIIAMTAVVAALVIVDFVLPASPQKRFVLDALVAAIWLIFFTGMLVRRRQRGANRTS